MRMPADEFYALQATFARTMQRKLDAAQEREGSVKAAGNGRRKRK